MTVAGAFPQKEPPRPSRAAGTCTSAAETGTPASVPTFTTGALARFSRILLMARSPSTITSLIESAAAAFHRKETEAKRQRINLVILAATDLVMIMAGVRF